jgi:predicted  nucleic acid-binding Zn-ribbon protein
MRIRHRIPSIFNLSMVDVLCCALGCVILLWLLNLKDARQRAVEMSETDQALATVRAERDQLRTELDALTARIAGLQADLASATGRESVLSSRLQAAEKRERDATAANEKARERITTLMAESASARKDLARQTELRIDLEKRMQASAQRAGDLSKRLAAADQRIKDLTATAELVPDLRDQLKSYREKLGSEEKRARALGMELEQAKKSVVQENQSLESLRGRAARLEQDLADANRRRAVAENRFAGIALTGKRVVFLVDMSGSMELVDPDTPAPSKWQGVRETVAKILTSLPDLEKFQVILFAEKTNFLLGEDGRWLNYDPKTSVDRVTRALAATKPEGGTNMYSALEAAFRLRSSGLDTIYLLSDGLPNVGEPLTEAQMQNLKETEKGEILGKHIRKKLKEVWNRPIDGFGRVRINSIGFFYESPDVGAFLWALSRENDGSFVGMSRP